MAPENVNHDEKGFHVNAGGVKHSVILSGIALMIVNSVEPAWEENSRLTNIQITSWVCQII